MTEEGPVQDSSEWWNPKLASPHRCSCCLAPLLVRGGGNETAAEDEKFPSVAQSGNRCSRCKRTYYCGPECQRKHWTDGGHRDHCRALLHLEKDFTYLAAVVIGPDNSEEELFNAKMIVEDLQCLASTDHAARAEGDKKFERKDWRGAASAYERALESTKEHTEQAKTIAEPSGELVKMQVGVLWDTNAGRIKSNLVAALLQMAAVDLQDLAGGPDDMPATNGDRIVHIIRQLGLGEARHTMRDRIFAKVDKLLATGDDGYAQHWWKLFYRGAQVAHCGIMPRQAMKYIEKAKDRVGTSRSTALRLFELTPEEKTKAFKLIESLEREIRKVLLEVTGQTTLPDTDGQAEPVLGNYFSSGFNPIPNFHPRLPIDSVQEEILAVRLLAAADKSVQRSQVGEDGRVEVVESTTYSKRARELLNKILTAVAQPPFLLFPATGSDERVPPISVHLLAFYFRACLSKSGMHKLKIKQFCQEATAWLTDEMAYSIATHAFIEVEDAHSPVRGHAKTLSDTGCGGCLPCSFRIVRAGGSDWGGGFRQAAHFGHVEWIAFGLNRLLEGAGHKSIVDTILECDSEGCNAIMHAVNDDRSRFSGLTVRLIVQAVAFSTPGLDEKREAIRKVLDTEDKLSYTPALASISLNNSTALAALVDLGGRLWDKELSGDTNCNGITRSMKEQLVVRTAKNGDENMRALISAIRSNTNERECCSCCGKHPRSKSKLHACSRCGRAKYCDEECQTRAYSKHRFVCTTAVVHQDEQWYNSNIQMPKP